MLVYINKRGVRDLRIKKMLEVGDGEVQLPKEQREQLLAYPALSSERWFMEGGYVK